jgi:hypothetical protein
VPERAALAQPDTEPNLPWSGRRHQVNGSDRVLGTHSILTDPRLPSVSVRWRLLAMVLVVRQLVTQFVYGAAQPHDGD